MAPSPQAQLLAPRRRFLQSERKDLWWVKPALTLLVFSAFIVYTTWRAFEGALYWHGPYLSPMYSPEIFGDSPHAMFAGKPSWWPGAFPWSPAFLILWAPGLFRFTCYYYRGAYYKAFWADPPGCTIGEPRNVYLGENSFPLIVQNIHRYALVFAMILVVFLSHDAWKAMWFTDPATGVESFGIGVGTLVLVVNVVLIALYTFGCHSLRHLVGGFLDRMSKAPVRKKAFDCVTCLNTRHAFWAWCSLFWVAFADLYVRMVASGAWTDWRLV